ncbi:hypothetical protein FJ548_25710 [Mesorhizobium sp. B2-4-17]|nr:hypothetical protein FJ548_25710 [Mesorhizobium sp. B2-4-17]
MDLPAPLLIFYVRNDALGDGLLRIPALRAARTAFPRSHIVYGSQGKSSLTGILHKHAAPSSTTSGRLCRFPPFWLSSPGPADKRRSSTSGRACPG